MKILADENYLWLVRAIHKAKFLADGHSLCGVGEEDCPRRGSADPLILEWLEQNKHAIITQDANDFHAINNNRIIILGLPPGKSPFTHRSDLVLKCIGRLASTFEGEANIPPGTYFLPIYNY